MADLSLSLYKYIHIYVYVYARELKLIVLHFDIYFPFADQSNSSPITERIFFIAFARKLL